MSAHALTASDEDKSVGPWDHDIEALAIPVTW